MLGGGYGDYYGYPNGGDPMCTYWNEGGRWSCVSSWKTDCEWLTKALDALPAEHGRYYQALCECATYDDSHSCNDQRYCTWLDDSRVWDGSHAFCFTTLNLPTSRLTLEDSSRLAPGYHQASDWRRERRDHCHGIQDSEKCKCPSLTSSGSSWDDSCQEAELPSYEGERVCLWENGKCVRSWETECIYRMQTLEGLAGRDREFYQSACGCLRNRDEFSCYWDTSGVGGGNCEWRSRGVGVPYCRTRIEVPDIGDIEDALGEFSDGYGAYSAQYLIFDPLETQYAERVSFCQAQTEQCVCQNAYIDDSYSGYNGGGRCE